jgi:hypothetical protein
MKLVQRQAWMVRIKGIQYHDTMMQDYFEADESGIDIQQQPKRMRTVHTVTATGLSQPSIGDLFSRMRKRVNKRK